MTFGETIYELLSTDPSLNELCPEGIHYENAIKNINLKKEWIVYSFNKSDVQRCIHNKLYTNYTLSLNIISPKSAVIEKINDYVVEYLDNKTYNNIKNIQFNGDAHTIDNEADVYVNTLIFTCNFID